MISADGRYVLVYNGEVYNAEELRPALLARGCRFRGHSDSEVMLESIAAFGVEATVRQLVGMFAFALWDRRDRTLTLVRDRLGIKPLYWAQFGRLFLFGSELKALRAHSGWEPRIGRSAVAAYFRHNYIPAPNTVYEGVFKLEPATILALPWQGEPTIVRYWDPRAVAREGSANLLTGSDDELVDRLEALLKDAVSRRMIADVPLGAFLSGGVDSSLVVALMQASAGSPVKTFSIGFDVPDHNEAPYAAAVAEHLGTDHTELMVTDQQARDVIPRLAEWYDEPFADSSQIPTFLVSEMTRRDVTVALSGDGGDELFAGYNRYQLTQRLWQALSRMPRGARRTAAALMTSVSPERWSRLLGGLPSNRVPPQVGDKIHKLAALLPLSEANAVYRQLVTHWEPGELMPGVVEARSVIWDDRLEEDFPSLLDRMQYLDMVTYLPDDILTKVDRASMAVALEARVPLIDHRVVEFAWRLPQQMKVRNGTSKWLLRQVLYRHVPRALIERPKSGFAIPLAAWLRGPLRDWAESLLDARRLREAGLVDAALVRRYWDEHLSGHRNWQYPLWDVLMLEHWRDRWGSASAGSQVACVSSAVSV